MTLVANSSLTNDLVLYHIPQPLLHQSWSIGWNESTTETSDLLVVQNTPYCYRQYVINIQVCMCMYVCIVYGMSCIASVSLTCYDSSNLYQQPIQALIHLGLYRRIMTHSDLFQHPLCMLQYFCSANSNGIYPTPYNHIKMC